MRHRPEPGGAPPPGSGLRRLGALGLLLLLPACGGSGRDDDAVAAAAAPAPAAAVDCGGVRASLGCSVVEVGGRHYRYSLQNAPADARGPVALVDLGGPGRALFASDDVLVFSEAWPGDEALLFVEEPWVTREPAAACTRALERFQRGLRTGSRGPARAVVGACGLREPGGWGWTPERYRKVVERIVAGSGLELTGVVAASYGAPRTEPLWGSESLRWLILSSPASRSATGAGYLAGRERESLAALAAACAGCDPRALAADAAATLARGPVELATRTPPVAAVDVEAALVAGAYLPPAERRSLAAALRRPAAGGAEAIGLLSDATLLRYGEYSMSPAMLAYFDEVCRRFSPWPGPDAPGLLAGLHAPCRFLGREQARMDVRAPARACVAHGTQDFVTPRAAAAAWARRLGAGRVAVGAGERHATPALAALCARRLGLG